VQQQRMQQQRMQQEAQRRRQAQQQRRDPFAAFGDDFDWNVFEQIIFPQMGGTHTFKQGGFTFTFKTAPGGGQHRGGNPFGGGGFSRPPNFGGGGGGFGGPPRACPDRAALGISPTAPLSEKVLKESLRTQAMKWHPDRHNGAEEKKKAEVNFKRVYDAYDALKQRVGYE
jgi:hypothetical protein